MTERQKFLNEVEAFLKRSKMGPTQFGLETMNDRAFMIRLRGGQRVNIDTAGKVRKFMVDWSKKNPKQRAAYQPAA